MSGPTWIDGYKSLQAAMAKPNGNSPAGYPRVTNQQAASILRTTMTAAAKHKMAAEMTERWYEVALALAGWRQPGDKFLVTPAHKNALFPDAELPVLWTLALSVATTAQNRGIPFTVPTVNPAVDYDAVLKQAWSKMQREAKATAQPSPPASTMPALPGGGEKKTTSPWVLFLVGYGLSKSRGF